MYLKAAINKILYVRGCRSYRPNQVNLCVFFIFFVYFSLYECMETHIYFFLNKKKTIKNDQKTIWDIN